MQLQAYDMSTLKSVSITSSIFLNTDNVLSCVLGLYASDIDLPLPTPEEVLLCTSTTTTEEVISADNYTYFYCLRGAPLP